MNVYNLSQKRLEIIFREFDNVYVSFSGGKDSGVLLNLTIEYVRRNCPGRKIGVFHIDYEAQYQMTTDYVDETLKSNSDILEIYRICLPIAAQCATSMYQSFWIPWDTDKKELWVRDIPQESINEENNPLGFFIKGMWDYDLQNKFSTWYHKNKKAKNTCCLVGIRTQESLNRWRAIHSDRNYHNYNGLEWTKKMSSGVFNAYPIYDWIVEDIWTANCKFEWKYNKLYDLFHMAGLTFNQMRVASPFNDCATESLKLYRVIDPKNWGKMVGRVNGVNFTGIYGGTTAMGWNSVKLPDGHTWKSYLEFLLKTLPIETANSYKKKLEKSIMFWENRGGCLSNNVIEKLHSLGVSIKVGEKTNYNTDKMPVIMPYLDDIDIDEFREIPTYKRMCICIMKNDHLCKYMGFSLTKTEAMMRSIAEKKYREAV